MRQKATDSQMSKQLIDSQMSKQVTDSQMSKQEPHLQADIDTQSAASE